MPPEKGVDGWEERRAFYLKGQQPLAWVDYGGESQRGWVRLTVAGSGCDYVADWSGVVELSKSLDACTIRRIDLALDLFDGSASHESVLAAHESGRFKRFEGGRNPKMKKIEGSCRTDGRTVYIGARASSRFIRCYEKGWQLCTKFPETFKTEDLRVFLPGATDAVKVADYYRVELELKAVDGAVIPWDVLTAPDAFFAGGAPYLSDLIGSAPERLPVAPELDSVVELESMIQNCRIAYGGLFKAWSAIHGDSDAAKVQLFDEVMADVPSDRLLKNGVLLLQG
jgi:Putative phage replication protein RstA